MSSSAPRTRDNTKWHTILSSDILFFYFRTCGKIELSQCTILCGNKNEIVQPLLPRSRFVQMAEQITTNNAWMIAVDINVLYAFIFQSLIEFSCKQDVTSLHKMYQTLFFFLKKSAYLGHGIMLQCTILFRITYTFKIKLFPE